MNCRLSGNVKCPGVVSAVRTGSPEVTDMIEAERWSFPAEEDDRGPPDEPSLLAELAAAEHDELGTR